MLSLRSLAFILCSAIRRARALSCAALHCFPDRINGRKMATNMATNMAAPMCSLLRTVYTPKAITARGAKDPFQDRRALCILPVDALIRPIMMPAEE